MLKKAYLVIFLILAGTAFFVVAEAQAVTGNCIFSAPIQQVVLNGFAHMCGADRPLCNYDKIASGIGECCGGFDIGIDGYTDCVKAGPSMALDINTTFPIEAWGLLHDTWTPCSSQDASLTELNNYCKSKGYARVWPTENPCYKAGSVIRYKWNGLLPMVAGSSAGLGYGLMKVKCSTTGYCTENWSCGAWSSCSSGQQTRTCSDINNCGTTASKPATSQACESLSCVTVGFGQEAVVHYSGDGTSQQYSCNYLYNHCKINGMIGRCCPAADSANADCMVDYPVRTLLQPDVVADKKTLVTGENWAVRGGLVIKVMSIDAVANPRQVWFSLYKNGVEVDNKITAQGQYYLYADNYQSNPDFNLFGVYVDSIFSGATSNMVQFMHAYNNSLWESNLSSCSENWSCGDWSLCSAFGMQTRICTDANSCGTTVTIPAVSQSCTCTESWSCGAWASCSAFGLQTRTCIDFFNCGTTVSKPTVSQSCDATCTENWSCGVWSACSAFGLQSRTCADANSCGTTVSKPTVSQSCDATCDESWSCGVWSTCSAGGQTRICTDANNCGTAIVKPVISQFCTAAVPNPTTMDISCPSLQAGDMVKVTGKPAIYTLNNDLKVLYFPSGDEYKSWRPTYGGYVSITEACFDSLPIPTSYPAAVNFRPGSYVIKKASAEQLYVIEPNNTLAKITPAVATALYGTDYQIMIVADVFWPHYINRGTDVVAAVPHPGMLVKSGAVTYYVDFGNKMREVDSAGIAANEFQTKFVRPVVYSLISTLSAGEKISNTVPSIVDKVQGSN